MNYVLSETVIECIERIGFDYDISTTILQEEETFPEVFSNNFTLSFQQMKFWLEIFSVYFCRLTSNVM